MRSSIFALRIHIPNRTDMLRLRKEDEWWHNHETALGHYHQPELIESDFRTATCSTASYYSEQLNKHIVIKRVTNYCQNHDQRGVFSHIARDSRIKSKDNEVISVEPSSSPSSSLSLLPILGIIYIEPSEVENGKTLNVRHSKQNSKKANDNSSDYSKPSGDLREFFKLNQLGLQIEQSTKSSTSTLHIKSKSSASLISGWDVKREQLEMYNCKDETSIALANSEEQKATLKSKTCSRLTSIKEVLKLYKYSPESPFTLNDNDEKQVEVRGHRTSVSRGGGGRKLTAVIGGHDREGDVVRVKTEPSEMKRRRRARRQQQQDRAEMRCGCRQQVAAVDASTSTSFSASTSASASASASLPVSAGLTAKLAAGVATKTVAETTTTTSTKTGFQVEARLKALKSNQPPEEQVAVVKQASLEASDLAAEKQRQQIITLPTPSSCSSSLIAPFLSLSPQLTPAFKQCSHCEQSSNEITKSTFTVELNGLNEINKKKRGNYRERARSRPRPSKQQRNAATSNKESKKTVDKTTCEQSFIRFLQPSQKSCLSQQALALTTRVQNPSPSILSRNKESSQLNHQHKSIASTLDSTYISQSKQLLGRQSKIEQQQQQRLRDTCSNNKFPIQESTRRIKRPRRRKRSVYVGIGEQIRRQEIGKRQKKEAALSPLDQLQETIAAITTTKPTNKLVTPNLKRATTNNNVVILDDNFNLNSDNNDNDNNNNDSKGVMTNCFLYKNSTSKVQNLIMQNRSSSSSSSSSPAPVASPSPSFANHRYTAPSSDATTSILANRDKRPLLGEGGLLTDRLMVFNRAPLTPVENHIVFPSKSSSPPSNPRQHQRIQLKTITELNPNLSSQSLNHNQDNNPDCDYLIANSNNNNNNSYGNADSTSNNLHPLEVLDQQTRMSISIYDPLPKRSVTNERKVIQSGNFHSSASNQSSNSFLDAAKYSTPKLGMHLTTSRWRQLDKGKDNLCSEYDRSKSKPTKLVNYLPNTTSYHQANVSESFDVTHQNDQDGQHFVEDEEERLRESFPLELRRPIIDLPVPIKRVKGTGQHQLESMTSVSSASADNILFVTIELGAHQTRPLRVDPSWCFEELVENVYGELFELQREASRIMTTTTTIKKKKTTRTLYEEARELAKLFQASLALSSAPSTEKDVGHSVNFIDSHQHQSNHHHNGLPLDPTAMSLSDRARMVGQVTGERSCLENETPFWVGNENWRYRKHGSVAKCEQKLTGVVSDQRRQLRVLNRDHERNSGGGESFESSHNQSGPTEPLSSHLSLPFPAAASVSIDTSATLELHSADRQHNLRRAQNTRTILQSDRRLGSIANVNTGTIGKGKVKAAEDEVGAGPQNEQTEVGGGEQAPRQANYQFGSSSNSLSTSQCSCVTTKATTVANATESQAQLHTSRQNFASINQTKTPGRTMKSANEDKRATTSQDCNSYNFVVSNSNNNRYIDYMSATTRRLESASSHVVQDNHSTAPVAESVVVMHPAWEKINRASETADSNKRRPDTIQAAAAATKINRGQQEQIQMKLPASGDSKRDYPLDNHHHHRRQKQQQAKQATKQVTSQPLSYARIQLVNKGESIQIISLLQPSTKP